MHNVRLRCMTFSWTTTLFTSRRNENTTATGYCDSTPINRRTQRRTKHPVNILTIRSSSLRLTPFASLWSKKPGNVSPHPAQNSCRMPAECGHGSHQENAPWALHHASPLRRRNRARRRYPWSSSAWVPSFPGSSGAGRWGGAFHSSHVRSA